MAALQAALVALGRPVVFVERGGQLAVAEGGDCQLGTVASGASLPLLAYVPALLPSELGDASFRADHGVEHAYVVGEMANGIASEEMVIAAARAGLLGVFGAAGLTLERVTSAIDRLQSAISATATASASKAWGVNLIHSPDDPRLESAIVDLLLARGVRFVSASAYLDLTVSIVRYRVSGIHRDASGAVVVPNRVMAKVSRVEVARRFFAPPPDAMLQTLVAQGAITAEQAELARTIPMADDVTAEADSGGHTDNRPLVLLLPSLQALRDEVARETGYAARVRVGAAGGIATPASVASAFAMGAAYVVTGSINQCTLEAGTSDAVREMLARAQSTDVAMAAAADMFEMGVKVQVLTRGSLFAVRAARLYELFRTHDSVEALPAAVREELEKKYFRTSLEDAWASCVAFFSQRDPAQLSRAEAEPRHKLGLIFRAYLGQASKWANEGVEGRQLDYQIWCGPSMGAFNEWARGSCLEAWESRRVVLLAKNLLVGAAVLTRVSAVRNQGVRLPAEVERFAPRTEAALDALVKTRPARPAPAESNGTAAASASASRAVHAGRSNDEPIAIVGMGAMFPEAPNLAAFWRLLRTGKDAIKDVPDTHWSVAEYYDPDPRAPDRTYAKRGAFLEPQAFDPTEFGIPPSILEATDTTQLLGLVVARMAMEDAGYVEGRAWDRNRASVILGVTGAQELAISLGARLGHPKWKRALEDAGVDAETAADVVQRISASYVGWQESSFPGLLGNVVAGRIANRLDFGGTNCILDAACASSLAAVHLAVLELRAGRSDLALTGGVDCLNDIFMHMCFSKTPALSASGEVRPFSASADGTLLGEGLGMVVLKRLSDAERDGDRVYAQILSVGTSSDGRAKSVYAPLPSGQARALNAAYEQAGVRPREVTLLEAHGTGTKAGDAAEFEALRSVYTQDETSPTSAPAWCTLGTVKSQLGHTKAAAGAAGLIKIALALHHKVLPPTLKVETPHAGLDLGTSPFSMSAVARPWVGSPTHARFAAVSSFGFGGSNFHIVATESEQTRTAPAWDGSVELLAISAPSAVELLAQLDKAAQVDAAGHATYFARARETFDPRHAHRFVAVVTLQDSHRGETSLAATLRSARPKIAAAPEVAFTLPGGVAYGVGPAQGSVAFLFPGQGAQSVGMLREIACIFPEFLAAIEGAPDLAAAIYPLATFDQAETARRTAHLTQTDVAQPALGLVERGLLEVLRRFGVTAAHVAGHSYGELAALHAAGILSADALDRASRARGAAMRGDGGDRGTMLAVLAPIAEVEKVLAEERLDLVIANRNGPAQTVLSGARTEIARAESACAARNLRTARLAVGAAFHSPLVAEAASTFGQALAGIDFDAARIPVIAGSTAEPYPADVAAAKAQLASQLAEPVRFADVVEALYARGARSFVEVGPKSALSGMVSAILDGRSFAAIALDGGDRRGGLADLASALAHLAARGHAVDVAAWQHEARLPETRKTKMNVPLNGANYRAPFEVKPKTEMRTPAPKSPDATQNHAPANVQNGHAPEAEARYAPQAPSAAHEGLRALQAMQEQTARVHQIFLEGQIAAHQSLQALLLGTTSAAPIAPVVHAPALPRAPRREAISASAPAAPVTPALVVAPAAAIAPAAVVAPAIDLVALLLDVVAQTTGYPVESLALEMDMEADLGIDSIKRVEILSLLSKRVPGAPSVNPEKLGALRTLAQVATFMREGTATLAPATPTATATKIAAASNGVAVEDARDALLAVVAQLTGYPRETLDLAMDMEADLGIDSIKRVEILSLLSKRIPNAPAVNPEKLAGLRTLDQVLGFATNRVSHGAPAAAANEIDQTPPAHHAPAPHAEAAPVVAPPPIRRGVVVAVAASEATGTSELPRGPIFVTRDHAGLADALVRRFAEAGADARVIDAAEVPAGPVGALVLLAPDQPVWGADSESDLIAALRAARSVGPRLRESGSSSSALLVAVSRRDGAFGHTTQSPTWNPLQAGLAGLVKSAAHEWPEVSCRAIDVASCLSVDEAAKAILGEIKNHGPREVGVGPAGRIALALRSPHLVHAQAPAHAREATVLSDGAILVTGGARGVTASCAHALALRTGAKLVLLGRSPEPTPEPAWLANATTEAEIKRACLENAPAGERPAPKALGEACRAVLANREVAESLRALAADGIEAVYRSVDVRDGARVAAIVSELRGTFGPFRAIVHGAGVIRDKRLEDKQDKDFEDVLAPKILGLRSLLDATKGDDLRSIVLFASATGRFGRRGQSDYAVANQALVSIAQVEAAKRPKCRVVALDWGPWEGGMVTPALRAEFEREGVPLLSLAQGSHAMGDEALAAPGGPTEIVLGAGFGSEEAAAWTLASSHRLDAASFPVLRDHVLAGKAVLPLALSIEWLVAGASHVECTNVTSLEDVRVFRGVTIGAEPDDVSVWVGPRESAESSRVVVELRGSSGQVHVRAHASFEAALSPSTPAFAPPESLRPFRTPIPHVYAEQLFHGASLHAIESIDGMSEAGMIVHLRSHPTSERLLPPPVLAWHLDPLALDGVFQALIVWCRENVGAPSLPSRIGTLRFLSSPLASPLRATVRIRSREGMVVRADVDLHDQSGALCVRVEGFECTASPSLQRAFAAVAAPDRPSTVPVA